VLLRFSNLFHPRHLFPRGQTPVGDLTPFKNRQPEGSASQGAAWLLVCCHMPLAAPGLFNRSLLGKGRALPIFVWSRSFAPVREKTDRFALLLQILYIGNNIIGENCNREK